MKPVFLCWNWFENCLNITKSLLGIETKTEDCTIWAVSFEHYKIPIRDWNSLVAINFDFDYLFEHYKIPIRDWNRLYAFTSAGTIVFEHYKIPIRDWNIRDDDKPYFVVGLNITKSLLGIETVTL